MRGQQDNAEVGRDKGHRVLLSSGEMGQEFGVPGKTIATKKQRSLVDGCGGNRINMSRCTQLNRCFNVGRCCFARSTGFNARLDKADNVVEVIDYRIGEVLGERFFFTNNVIPATEIESAGGVGQQLSVTNYHRSTNPSDF